MGLGFRLYLGLGFIGPSLGVEVLGVSRDGQVRERPL